MNNAQQTARVGLFFLLGLALVWVTFETLSDGKIFKDRGYTVIAGFEDLKELKLGDEVRMAGVKIGSVELTRLTGRRAEAVLRIDPGVQIAGDANATIAMSGLIGNNYISIDLGTRGAAPLPPGAEIHTTVTPDLNSIMSQLGNLGSKLDGALGSIGDALKGKDGQPGLFQRLDTLVGQNSEKITATVANLQEVSAKINKGEGTLGKLVNDSKLHDDLLATVGEIKAAATEAKTMMGNAEGIVDQVKSGHGALGALVYDDATANDIKASVKNVRDVSDKIARGEGTLGKLINDDSLFRDAQGTLKKADRALDGLDDAGPINALGVVAKSLF
ncbi:MAG TPA: MlaD family protein [Opitutaceae bacterium]|nr:MlaD family protein [Opitutaceae bacterium]